MRRTLFTAVALSLSAVATTAAHAETTVITGGSGQRAFTIPYAGTIGQSFTVNDTVLQSFGFQFNTLNALQSNAPVTLTIREGAGLTGDIVASVTATLFGIPATRAPTFFDFNFSDTALISGQSYTALLSTNSARYGLVYGPDINLSNGQFLGGDAYANGSLISERPLFEPCLSSGICDANFRFTTTAAIGAVPEPATWAMMIMGFGLIGGALRARRHKTRVAFAI